MYNDFHTERCVSSSKSLPVSNDAPKRPQLQFWGCRIAHLKTAGFSLLMQQAFSAPFCLPTISRCGQLKRNS
jgi:hypothetical protein